MKMFIDVNAIQLEFIHLFTLNYYIPAVVNYENLIDTIDMWEYLCVFLL